ncbi:hypothetical protein KBB96_18215 [Luteolibacter ambystomatis]|uniref:Uncharacterized protein n=1 Tax=Luteolibacter ambystomatis TaxID=2824561 RepID=A0A975G8J8_9BACT|nr:hypothetical protein [Luteolibacter ambystomatis]QUE50783.1 hypothetical protein KBB96_18215 [Luteolibacter ambystomatis]
MKRIALLGIGSLVLLFVSLHFFAPYVLYGAKKASGTQAVSNARSIGLALFDFDSDYGRFPDASTIAAVKAVTDSTWDLKDRTSNDLFKQIIVSGITTSEEIFYAKASGARKPDSVIVTEDRTLAQGECGFAYIAGAATKCDPMRPLAVTPLIPGTFKFDPKPFDGRAIILRADNSAASYIIRKDGTVIAPGGKDLFDPSQPYWRGAPPDVKWADLPVPPASIASPQWMTWVVPASIATAVMILILSIMRGRKMLLKKYPSAFTE